jgi:hypothetical protein
MEFNWYCAVWLVWSNKGQICWGFLWVPKGHEWACWKGRKPTAWHLMADTKHLGKQGCNCQFRNHKIFNPCKSRSVNFALQLCSCTSAPTPALLFVANLLFIIYSSYSLFCVLFQICIHPFCSVISDRFCFLLVPFHLIIGPYSKLFLLWSWKCVPGISIPITTTI